MTHDHCQVCTSRFIASRWTRDRLRRALVEITSCTVPGGDAHSLTIDALRHHEHGASCATDLRATEATRETYRLALVAIAESTARSRCYCDAYALALDALRQVAVEAIIDERDALLDEARVIIDTAHMAERGYGWELSWNERRRAWLERCKEVAK